MTTNATISHTASETALITQEQSRVLQTLPIYQRIGDPLNFCQEVGKSLAVTFGLNSPHHGTVMALAMLCKNRDPLEHIQRYHGDGSMRASAVQAEFQSRGGRIEWIELGDESNQAKAAFTHPIYQKTPLTITYTLEDAKRQVGEKFGKDGSNWKTNPGAMLRAALIRKAIKIIDPGIIGGYDSFVDTDYAAGAPITSIATQAAAALPAAKSAADQAARRAELMAGMNATPQNSSPSSSETLSATTAKVEQVETSVVGNAASPSEPVEEVPFETEAASVDREKTPCTDAQIQEITLLASKFPSPDDPSRKMDIGEIQQNIAKACKVAEYRQATMGQIDRLIVRFRELLSAMPAE